MVNATEVADRGYNPQYAENPRAIFKHEVKPALAIQRELTLLNRGLSTYESSLLPAAFHRDLSEDVIRASFMLIGQRRITREEQERSGLDGQPLMRQAQNRILDWFNELSPNARHQLSQLIDDDPQKQQALDQVMAANLAHCVTITHSLARNKAAREHTVGEEIAKMAKFLLENSSKFEQLNKRVSGYHQENLSQLRRDNNLDLAALELVRGVEDFELREWIAENAKQARLGKRIYDTPFYRDLLEQIHIIGRKRNGIGGVILYGPPGVGKTELLQEKNNREGFEGKTRVVSIHHYISNADLLGEQAIKVSGSDDVSPTERRIAYFEQASVDKFESAVLELFEQLKSEGKIDQHERLGRFLLYFVSLKNNGDRMIDVLKKDEFDDNDWTLFRDAYLTKQRARLLRGSLPEQLQEEAIDFAKGEIIYALTVTKERIILDEVDKARTALGGLLGFLAKSPGDVVKFGNATYSIEEWFKVDATSNTTQLNEYLTSRFSALEVTTPSPKDQLMIASVRISDVEGNILLNEYEQRHLGAFFVYVLPELNKILQNADPPYPPLGNREIQELCSYLVDFNSMQRTEISFNEAVRMLLTQNKIWSKDPQVSEGVNKLLDKFKLVVADETSNLGFIEESELKEPSRREHYHKGLEDIQTSPLMRIINGLEDKVSSILKPRAQLVGLSDQHIMRVDRKIDQLEKEQIRGVRAPNNIRLGLGFVLRREAEEADQSTFRLIDIDSPEIDVLTESTMAGSFELAVASSDGKKAVVRSDEDIRIIEPFNLDPKQPMKINVAEGVEVKTDMDVNFVGILTKAKGAKAGNLQVYQAGEGQFHSSIGNVQSFQFSPDGRLILINSLDGVYLFDTRSKSTLGFIPGGSWHFLSDKLLVSENQAFLIT